MHGAASKLAAFADGSRDGNDGTHRHLITTTGNRPWAELSPRTASRPILRIRRHNLLSGEVVRTVKAATRGATRVGCLTTQSVPVPCQVERGATGNGGY